MIKNYLLITLRSMMKNKLFIFINIFGLAISIACCIVGYFNYDFNASFDIHHKNAATIYRVNSIREFQNDRQKYGYVPYGLGNVIKQNVKDVDEVIRYSPGGGNFRVKEELFNSELTYVDPEFFNAFTYEFIDGSPSLKDKTTILISDELAKKYFGNDKAVGKFITQVLDSGKLREYQIGGVFKRQPTNSSFYTQTFTNFHNQFDNDSDLDENSWRYRMTLFLQVKDKSKIAAIEQQIKPFVENNNKIREDFIIRDFTLQSFEGMAVSDSYNEVPGTWTNDGSPIAAVVGVGMMGALVLLIACFNLTNTAIAISSGRLKEIGIRKVMGGMRGHLISQFLGETILICFVALLLGILIAEFALIPAFNSLWPNFNLDPEYFERPNFLIFMIITLIFTGLLAGGYPAFYVSKFQPISILKGKLKFGGTNFFTRILLTLQFAISLIGIVCGFAFTDNARYQQQVDLGFDRNGVIFTNVENRSEFEIYRNELLKNPEIVSIAGSEHHLYSSAYNDPIKADEKEIEVDILNVGDDYLKTVGLTLNSGRDFTKDSETDKKESVIVTEGLVRKFGWADPIGKEILWMDTVKFYVIGVVKDVYNNGLWDQMDPIMMRYNPDKNIRHIIVSTKPAQLLAMDKFMETKWKELFPNKLYNGRTMDEELAEAVTVNKNIVKMFVFLGVIALLLSATGLFTLVSLNIIKKMKEIGVRKVLGASVAHISTVINKEFALILLIACGLGGWLGSFMSAMLMDSIWDYYQKATVATLVTSAAIIILASALSVGYKIYKTVKLNPAHVLRDE